ncbi:pleckstrin homology-like domain family B member 3 isoform X2 [Vidua chalybeata]|uniref:pleckstrin homology-like domain family B member 3 isoform X2 n=1 Tax=Vidua chalybeata TaxID=81927 RepID=UPI0023A8F0CE|nr:pleckstrin homology-like domain family B member 3 isoform X2 [Vidua chalybeata]
MVHRGGGDSPPSPPGPGDGPAAALEGLRLEDERPPKEGGGAAMTSETISSEAVTSETMTSEMMTSQASVTAGGQPVLAQLMFSHCTDRRWILLGPPCDPPRVLALRSSVQGAIGLQRSGSLPRRRVGEGPGPPHPPRPRSQHGHGALALQLDPESYSTCLRLAQLELRVREALAERERLLRAREARKAAKAPPTTDTPISHEATPSPAQDTPPVAQATPPPEPDLLCALRARGHRPEAVGGLRILGGSLRGPLTKMGGRIKTWRRRWFHLDPQRRVLAYYGDQAQTKLKGVIYFQAIEEVWYDPGRVAGKSPNPRLTFCLKTYERLFWLVAPSAEALRIWMDAVLTLTRGSGSF